MQEVWQIMYYKNNGYVTCRRSREYWLKTLILLTTSAFQSYKSYYMVSPQTVFTYHFHHAKLQVLLHGVTANSLYLSFSPCKATNLTTWCHRKQSLLISFSPCKATNLTTCKATNLTTWCHRKQSLLILFTMQSYKSYYTVSPQTVFTYPFHHAKLQILLHGVTANSLYLSFSPCKSTNITWICTFRLNLKLWYQWAPFILGNLLSTIFSSAFSLNFILRSSHWWE